MLQGQYDQIVKYGMILSGQIANHGRFNEISLVRDCLAGAELVLNWLGVVWIVQCHGNVCASKSGTTTI